MPVFRKTVLATKGRSDPFESCPASFQEVTVGAVRPQAPTRPMNNSHCNFITLWFSQQFRSFVQKVFRCARTSLNTYVVRPFVRKTHRRIPPHFIHYWKDV